MEEHDIISQDQHRTESYQKMKKILDTIHDRFINDSLSDTSLDWSEFYEFYQSYRSIMKNKKDLSDKEKKTVQKQWEDMLMSKRKTIGELFDITADKRKSNPARVSEKNKPFLSNNGYKILTEKGILDVLLDQYHEDQQQRDIINEFS